MPGKNKSRVTNLKLLYFCLFYIIITLLVMNNPFFWDTIQLASKHAHWYYENNFRYLLLPDSIDSGHPPVFGIMLALSWKIAGKSLPVSHLFMLPFLLGIVFQTNKLLNYFLPRSTREYIPMIILLIDPTILGQSILVSPDIPLLFFFLLTLNSILDKNLLLLILGSIGLSVISTRGMMVCALLAVFAILVEIKKPANSPGAAIKTACNFIPAGLIALSYLAYHFIRKGWIGYHAGSPWAPCFERVDLSGFFYNIGIYCWRLIDFGKLFIWLTMIFIAVLYFKKIKIEKKGFYLVLLNFLFLLIFPIPMLTREYLLGHRYLIPSFFLFSLLVLYFMEKTIVAKRKKTVLSVLIIAGLLSGNFWVYPEKIAIGWDSTLAHVPYYKLREKMVRYIDSKKIPYDEIGSGFPNITSFKYTNLTPDTRAFVEKNLDERQYIFYSNVFNSFTDEEIDELKTRWILEKEFRCVQVKMQLYRNPRAEDYQVSIHE